MASDSFINQTENNSLTNVQAYLSGTEPYGISLPVETLEEYQQRMQWWRDAKYGMFIHWGLYTLLAGEYQGKITPKIAEWIQNTLRIPLAEYKRLMKDFNPTKFDAQAWVSLAKAAGMKYIVITTKHHDGFAMFDTQVNDYSVMHTPFARDVIKELSEETRRQGLHFGIYYSHVIDWQDPNAYIGDSEELYPRMNIIDFDPKTMDRNKYLQGKVLPQLHELLTNYGKIDIIWFDMGEGFSNNNIRTVIKHVRELQPHIVISSRVGDEAVEADLHRDMLFDYFTPNDNYFTGQPLSMPWEMAGTTNSSWGFRKDDNSWRSASFIIQSLLATVSRGGNYLLNVGPDTQGIIPMPAAEQLRLAGSWIHTHGTAIFNTQASPFPWNFDWGYVTATDQKLFLHVVTTHPISIALSGVISSVSKVEVLHTGQQVAFTQRGQLVTLDLSQIEAIPEFGYVLVVHHDDKQIKINKRICQVETDPIRLDRICGKYDQEHKLISWDFTVTQPGTYQVAIVSNEKGSHHHPKWTGSEQTGAILVADQVLPVVLQHDHSVTNPTLFFYQQITSNIGNVTFPRAGTYTLHLKGFMINAAKWKPGLGLEKLVLTTIKN